MSRAGHVSILGLWPLMQERGQSQSALCMLPGKDGAHQQLGPHHATREAETVAMSILGDSLSPTSTNVHSCRMYNRSVPSLKEISRKTAPFAIFCSGMSTLSGAGAICAKSLSLADSKPVSDSCGELNTKSGWQ